MQTSLPGGAVTKSKAEARPVKIALCGAHGTGKTTILNVLREVFREADIPAVILPEVPRVVCAAADDPEFFRRGKNSLARQLLLLVGQPVHESLASTDSQIILCDRTLLDHWAYTRVLFEPQLREEQLLTVLDSFVEDYSETYSQLFYLPIEFPPKDDGTREADAEFQRLIDIEIRGLMTRFDLQPVTLHGSVSERLITLRTTLKSALGLHLPEAR